MLFSSRTPGRAYLPRVQLHFKSIGAGEPLVILHGLFGTLDNWQTVGRAFAKTRRVLLVDQRNHGKSPHRDTHDYPGLAADLAAWLDAEGLECVDVLGHSMGGKTAMQFALDYPDRVRRLVVVDMTPRAYPGGHEAILAAMASVPVVGGTAVPAAGAADLTRADIEALLARTIPEAGVRLFLMKNLRRERAGGYAWKLNLDALTRDYPRVLEPVSGEPWAGPALFVRGERSGYVRDEDLPGIEALFPGARLVTIAGAGHWVHAEAPDALYEAVEGFLAEAN